MRADLLEEVSVPKYAFAGGTANIGCKFNLRQTPLYSLKWYHNNTEFYRYVPTERKTPINIKPSQKFVLHVRIPLIIINVLFKSKSYLVGYFTGVRPCIVYP